MDRQNSSALWLKCMVMAVAFVSCYGGMTVAFAQVPDDGADSLTTSTSSTVIDLSTNDGGGDSTGGNSGGSGNSSGNSGNSNNNAGTGNRGTGEPPPCVPPPPGLLGGVANIIGIVVNPCS